MSDMAKNVPCTTLSLVLHLLTMSPFLYCSNLDELFRIALKPARGEKYARGVRQVSGKQFWLMDRNILLFIAEVLRVDANAIRTMEVKPIRHFVVKRRVTDALFEWQAPDCCV
jgi:hypothetical protein